MLSAHCATLALAIKGRSFEFFGSYHHSQHLLNSIIQNRIFHGRFDHYRKLSMLHGNDDVGHSSCGFTGNGYFLTILFLLGGGAANVLLREQIHTYLGDETAESSVTTLVLAVSEVVRKDLASSLSVSHTYSDVVGTQVVEDGLHFNLLSSDSSVGQPQIDEELLADDHL